MVKRDATDDASEVLEAWSMRVSRGEGPKSKDAVMTKSLEAGLELLVLDGAMVFGADHLRSALRHAARAIKEGTNSSQSLSMETLLYASGERQLSAAIKKMSVSERTEEVVVARLSKGPFRPDPGWTPIPNLPQDVPRDRLLRFGISPKELVTVDDRKAAELVLERVAAVDIIKR